MWNRWYVRPINTVLFWSHVERIARGIRHVAGDIVCCLEVAYKLSRKTGSHTMRKRRVQRHIGCSGQASHLPGIVREVGEGGG